MCGSTDLERMARFKRGDLTAVEELFERHHGRLFGYFVRLTGSVALSQDLVQEVFVRVLRYGDSFGERGSVAGWLFSLAHNVLRDQLARTGTDVQPVGSEIPDSGPGPDELLERQRETAVLRTALARLPLEQRELLVLARFEGLPYAQIAEALGCSVGAVKVRVHRTVRELGRIVRGLSGREVKR